MVASSSGLGSSADQLAAGGRQLDLLVVVVVFVVLVVDELRHDFGRPAIRGHDLLDRLVAERADDQRRAGFVDQNAVGFVDEAEVGPALHGLLAAGIEAGGGDLAKQAGLRARPSAAGAAGRGESRSRIPWPCRR